MNHFTVLFLRVWFYYNTFSFSFLPPNHLLYPSHCLSNYDPFFSLIIIYGRNSWPKVVWEDWSDICQEKLMSTMWWISEELTLVLSWDANRSWMKRPRQKRKDIWVRIFQCQGLRENFHVCLFFFLAYLLFFVSSLISNRNIYVPCVKSSSFGAFSFIYFC